MTRTGRSAASTVRTGADASPPPAAVVAGGAIDEPRGAIFRPVQYLGSKLRVVDAIAAAARELTPSGLAAVDLFSGSSVVAQGLERAGYVVTAVDAQAYATFFARALLGVGRASGEIVGADALVASVLSGWTDPSTGWSSYARREAALLDVGDAAGLRSLSEELPLAWRRGRHVADAAAPMASFYSGTYFGLRQAMDLDALRHAISASPDHLPGSWRHAAALTALLHAASLAVHSAGKHFAQPLRARPGNAAFLDRRMVADRSVDVVAAFASACDTIARVAPFRDRGHAAIHGEAERQLGDRPRRGALYYLDPPYTAQQYSRFYHILETIALGDRPSLPAGTNPTSGLYPADRFKSAFSSRRRAPDAMRHLLGSIAAAGSAALVSYSVSSVGSDGNARMITLEDLLSACRESFGRRRVEVLDLDHRYRQFNSVDRANAARDDREVLVLCRSA